MPRKYVSFQWRKQCIHGNAPSYLKELLTHQCIYGNAPSYLKELLTHQSVHPRERSFVPQRTPHPSVSASTGTAFVPQRTPHPSVHPRERSFVPQRTPHPSVSASTGTLLRTSKNSSPISQCIHGNAPSYLKELLTHQSVHPRERSFVPQRTPHPSVSASTGTLLRTSKNSSPISQCIHGNAPPYLKELLTHKSVHPRERSFVPQRTPHPSVSASTGTLLRTSKNSSPISQCIHGNAPSYLKELLTHQCIHGNAPSYLKELLTHQSVHPRERSFVPQRTPHPSVSASTGTLLRTSKNSSPISQCIHGNAPSYLKELLTHQCIHGNAPSYLKELLTH
ncbi:Zinc finger protein 585B, partial [Dissostichus eleginoides]